MTLHIRSLISFGLLLLLIAAMPSSLAAPLSPIKMVDLQLSNQFYLGHSVTLTAILLNQAPSPLQISKMTFQAAWPPYSTNTTITENKNITILPGAQFTVFMNISVPTDLIPTTMHFRVGVTTQFGDWFDIWRTNQVHDYWYDAYNSLKKSIIDRLQLKNAKYASSEANDLASQATDLLTQAETPQYVGTEAGYNMLLKASKLIDQADNAEVSYQTSRSDNNAMIALLVLVAAIIVGVLGYFNRRKSEREVSHARLRRKQ